MTKLSTSLFNRSSRTLIRLWAPAMLMAATGCSAFQRGYAYVPKPKGVADVEVRNGVQGDWTEAELSDLITQDYPDTKGIEFFVTQKQANVVVTNSVNSTMIYVRGEPFEQALIIKPDETGSVGVASSPVGNGNRLVRMKPPVYAVAVKRVHETNVLVVPPVLSVGRYAVVDAKSRKYFLLEIRSAEWTDVQYRERLRSVRDQAGVFSIKTDLSYAFARQVTADHDDVTIEDGSFTGPIVRLHPAANLRLPLGPLASLELYAGVQFAFVKGAIKVAGNTETPAVAPQDVPVDWNVGFGFATGLRPEIPLAAFSRGRGLALGVDVRLEIDLIPTTDWSITVSPGASIVPDLTFVLRSVTLTTGFGYDFGVKSSLFRTGIRF